MPGTHALLSPSAAHRWLNCTAAPRLEQAAPDNETDYAAEGTLAHAYCARHLKTYLGLDVTDEDREIEQYGRYHTGEMDEYTETYKTIILEKYNAAKVHTKDALLLVETRLDFSNYVPEAFGTADAIIIADGTMEIIDFKYGKGVRISAKENPQMKIYAIGAYDRFSFEYDIQSVRMAIVQPRIDNLSEYELTTAELIDWAENTLAPKAKEAFEGKGEQVPGPWCQFCKVKAQCRKLARQAIDTQAQCDPKLLSPAEIAEIVLPQIDVIKSWLKGVEDYTLQQALAGTNYPGFKIVEGRSVRKISDPAAVKKLLTANGYDEADYMKPAELCTITDLEKLVGKKKFGLLCADYITKPQGKPTLVPESDKRPAFNAAADDFKDM